MVPCMLLFHWIHLSWTSPGHKIANFSMSCGEKTGGPNWSYFQSTRGSWSNEGHVTLQNMQQMTTNRHVPMYPCNKLLDVTLQDMLTIQISHPTAKNESFGRSHRFPLPDLLAAPCRYQPENSESRKWWTQINVLLGRFCRNVKKSRMVVDTS